MCVCLSARLQLSAIGPKDTTSSSPPGASIMYNLSTSSHFSHYSFLARTAVYQCRNFHTKKENHSDFKEQSKKVGKQ